MSGYPPDGSQPQGSQPHRPGWQAPGGPRYPYGQPPSQTAAGYQPGFPSRPPFWSGRKIGCVVLLLSGAALSLAVCCGGLLFLTGSFGEGYSDSLGMESDSQRQERLVQGFAGDQPVEQSPMFAGIDALMCRTMAASENETTGNLVDSDLLYREMVATKKMDSVPRFTRSFFMEGVTEEIEVIAPFDEYIIASIVPHQGKQDEATVMVHLFSAGQSWRMSLYVVRKDDQWKIYDWCEVGQNVRKSFELAVINGNQAYSKYQSYMQFYDNLTLAVEAEEPDRIQEYLRKAEPGNTYSELKPHMWSIVGSYWCDLGYPEEGIRCLDQLADPESPADAVLYRGNCFYSQGEYAKAIESFNRYEELTGNSIYAKESRAEAFDFLEQETLARREYEAILKLNVNHSCINQLARLTSGREALESLVESIKRTDKPLASAERIGILFSDWGSYRGLLRMSQLTSELNEDCAASDFLRGLVLDREDRIDESRPLLQKALQRTTDDDQRYDREYALSQSYFKRDEALAYYQSSQDKNEAFENIYWAWDEDLTVEGEAIVQVARLHLENNPDDEYARSVVLSEMAVNQQYDETIADFSELSTDEYGFYDVIVAYVKTGRELEALEKFQPFGRTFTQVSGILRDEKEFDRLDELMDKYRNSYDLKTMERSEDSQWQSLYAASVLNRAAILNHKNSTTNAIAFLLRGSTEIEENWTQRSLKQECISISMEMGLKARDLWNLKDDKYVVNHPSILHGSQGALDWQTLESQFNTQFWNQQYSEAETMLEIFSDWRKTRPEIQVLRAKLLKAQGEYPAAAALLSENWLKELIARHSERQQAEAAAGASPASPYYYAPADPSLEAYSLIVELSQLTGDLDRAKKYADLLAEEHESSGPQLQLACLTGDVQKVTAILEKHPEEIYELRSEEQILRAFNSSKFDSVRKRYPASWESDIFDTRTILLFKAPVSLDANRIREVIDTEFVRESFGSVTYLDAVEAAESRADMTAIFRIGPLLTSISVGTKPLALRQTGIASQSLQKLLKEPASWIAIATAVDTAHNRYDVRQVDILRRRMETMFRATKPDAIIHDWYAVEAVEDIKRFFDPKYYPGRMYEIDSAVSMDYATDKYWTQLPAKRFAELCDAAEKLNEAELGKLKLEIVCTTPSSAHRCQVSVYRIEPGSYDDVNFCVEFSDNHPLLQFKRSDQKYFVVDATQISDWTIK